MWAVGLAPDSQDELTLSRAVSSLMNFGRLPFSVDDLVPAAFVACMQPGCTGWYVQHHRGERERRERNDSASATGKLTPDRLT
jgi:hypothetical protein